MPPALVQANRHPIRARPSKAFHPGDSTTSPAARQGGPLLRRSTFLTCRGIGFGHGFHFAQTAASRKRTVNHDLLVVLATKLSCCFAIVRAKCADSLRRTKGFIPFDFSSPLPFVEPTKHQPRGSWSDTCQELSIRTNPVAKSPVLCTGLQDSADTCLISTMTLTIRPAMDGRGTDGQT